MILQIYNRLRQISIKIEFGIPSTSCQASGIFLFGCVVFIIASFNAHLQTILGESEESLVRLRGLNITHKSQVFYCELPYDDCLCPVLSNLSNTSKNCITNVQLVGSRTMPLVSFFL